MKETVARDAGENADLGDSAGGGDVSSGGIIAEIQTALRDVRGDARERAVPHLRFHATFLNRALDSRCFFASCSAVYENGPGKLFQYLCF